MSIEYEILNPKMAKLGMVRKFSIALLSSIFFILLFIAFTVKPIEVDISL